MASLSEFTQLLKDVAMGKVAPTVQVELATAWLKILEQDNPFVYSMVIGFVSAPPAVVITTLGSFDRAVSRYADNVQALQFVELLQKRLQG